MTVGKGNEWMGRMLLALVLMAGTAVAAAAQPAAVPQAPDAAQKGFLVIQEGRLLKDGRPVSIRTNCADPAVGHWFKFQGPWLEAAIRDCKSYGFNALSTWVTGTNDAESEAVYLAWKRDPKAFFGELDTRLVGRCKAEGIYLVLMFAVPFPARYAGGDYLDTNSAAYRLYSAFAKDVCRHYRDEPQILFWEAAGEGPEARAGDGIAKVVRFYERITQDIRSVDPNHLLSSGTANPLGSASRTWQRISAVPGIDLPTMHVYKYDGWTQNYETERDYVRLVHDLLGTARPLGKPVYFGEVGVEPRQTPRSGEYENPGAVWYLKALARAGVQAYGFHWIHHSRSEGLFNLLPERSPQTAEWIAQLNGLLAKGAEVPADFGPKTTDYAFLICAGPKELLGVFGGPAPRAHGAVTVGKGGVWSSGSGPSIRVHWGKAGGGVELGPYHANDLTEYVDAGGTLKLTLRLVHGRAHGLRMLVRDEAGGEGSASLTEARGGAGLATRWAQLSLPLSRFGRAMDWARWISVGFEFPAGSPGQIEIGEVEVVSHGQGLAGGAMRPTDPFDRAAASRGR